MLVATLDIPAVKNLRVAMNTLDTLGASKDGRVIVLNRSDAKVGLKADDVEVALKHRSGTGSEQPVGAVLGQPWSGAGARRAPIAGVSRHSRDRRSRDSHALRRADRERSQARAWPVEEQEMSSLADRLEAARRPGLRGPRPHAHVRDRASAAPEWPRGRPVRRVKDRCTGPRRVVGPRLYDPHLAEAELAAQVRLTLRTSSTRSRPALAGRPDAHCPRRLGRHPRPRASGAFPP